MVSDSTIGNITTIATWIITVFGTSVGTTALTNNDLVGVVTVVIAAVINYFNMKYNNTIVEPKNAIVGDNGEMVCVEFGDDGEA